MIALCHGVGSLSEAKDKDGEKVSDDLSLRAEKEEEKRQSDRHEQKWASLDGLTDESEGPRRQYRINFASLKLMLWGQHEEQDLQIFQIRVRADPATKI